MTAGCKPATHAVNNGGSSPSRSTKAMKDDRNQVIIPKLDEETKKVVEMMKWLHEEIVRVNSSKTPTVKSSQTQV